MNNNLNVQSPSFGMAYRVGDVKQMAKYLNEQEPAVIKELGEKMANAVEKLKDTKYADAVLYADNERKTLGHAIQWKHPVFKEDGTIFPGFSGVCMGGDIDKAVEATLEKENAMAAAFEYAEKQAEVLKKMAQ